MIYKQNYHDSCLVACLIRLVNKKITEKEYLLQEKSIFFEGEKRKYLNYVLGIPISFLEYYPITLIMLVNTKFYTECLKKYQNGYTHLLKIRNEKICSKLIVGLLEKGKQVVCRVDDHELGGFSHVSHFILLERFDKRKRIIIFDPWDAKRKYIRVEKLDSAIMGLKKQIKISPIIYYLGENRLCQ